MTPVGWTIRRSIAPDSREASKCRRLNTRRKVSPPSLHPIPHHERFPLGVHLHAPQLIATACQRLRVLGQDHRAEEATVGLEHIERGDLTPRERRLQRIGRRACERALGGRRIAVHPQHAVKRINAECAQYAATPSVDTSNPATDVHRKTGHHDSGLRLVIGLA